MRDLWKQNLTLHSRQLLLGRLVGRRVNNKRAMIVSLSEPQRRKKTFWIRNLFSAFGKESGGTLSRNRHLLNIFFFKIRILWLWKGTRDFRDFGGRASCGNFLASSKTSKFLQKVKNLVKKNTWKGSEEMETKIKFLNFFLVFPETRQVQNSFLFAALMMTLKLNGRRTSRHFVVAVVAFAAARADADDDADVDSDDDGDDDSHDVDSQQGCKHEKAKFDFGLVSYFLWRRLSGVGWRCCCCCCCCCCCSPTPLPSLFPFRPSFLLLRLQAHELFWNSSQPGTWTIIVKENESFLKKPHLFQFNFESAETSENTRTKETDLRLRKLNQLNEAKRFGLDVAAAAVVFIPGLEFYCTMFKRREGLQQHDGGRQRGFNFTASLWKKFRNSLDAVDVETAELSTLRLLCLIWLVFNYFLTLAGRLRFNGALLAFSGLATTAIAGGGRERGWKKWGWVRETWVSARPTFLPPSSSPLPLSLSKMCLCWLLWLLTFPLHSLSPSLNFLELSLAHARSAISAQLLCSTTRLTIGAPAADSKLEPCKVVEIKARSVTLDAVSLKFMFRLFIAVSSTLSWWRNFLTQSYQTTKLFSAVITFRHSNPFLE